MAKFIAAIDIAGEHIVKEALFNRFQHELRKILLKLAHIILTNKSNL